MASIDASIMNLPESPKAKGGKARAAKLTPEARSAIAREAATARWAVASISNDGADLAESGPRVYVKYAKVLKRLWKEITPSLLEDSDDVDGLGEEEEEDK